MESRRAQEAYKARERATALGHKMGGWLFPCGMTQSACTVCGCSMLVTPSGAIGGAVTLTCKDGEPRKPVTPVQVPPTGKAKRVPKPAPVPPITDADKPGVYDDVPFPTDARERDAMVLR